MKPTIHAPMEAEAQCKCTLWRYIQTEGFEFGTFAQMCRCAARWPCYAMQDRMCPCLQLVQLKVRVEHDEFRLGDAAPYGVC